jgi:hypothetical protein
MFAQTKKGSGSCKMTMNQKPASSYCLACKVPQWLASPLFFLVVLLWRCSPSSFKSVQPGSAYMGKCSLTGPTLLYRLNVCANQKMLLPTILLCFQESISPQPDLVSKICKTKRCSLLLSYASFYTSSLELEAALKISGRSLKWAPPRRWSMYQEGGEGGLVQHYYL